MFAHDNYFDSEELDYPIRFKTNAERGGSIDSKNALYMKGVEHAPIENIVLVDKIFSVNNELQEIL